MGFPAFCLSLAQTLGPKLGLVNSTVYKESTSSYFTALESEIASACVAAPSSGQDVVDILKTVKPFVDSGECHLAIKARGNQPFAGAANIAGGVTIDLRSLQNIEIRAEGHCVSVGAGVSWGQLYEKLATVGLAVAGGRSSQGGIGGLTLGGGFSFFSTRQGWVSDSVKSFEVVLANGSIVNANAQENPDLWAALKGGSNNFGIVTAFDLLTFPQGDIYGGNVVYTTDLFPQQLQALGDYAANPDSDQDIHLIISIAYSSVFGLIVCQNSAYATKGELNASSIKPFTPLQPPFEAYSTLRNDSVKGFADEQTKGSPPGKRTIYLTTTIKSSVGLMNTITSQFNSSVEKLKTIDGIVYSLSFQPVTTALIEYSLAHGPNSFGLDTKTGSLINVLIIATWAKKEDDSTIEKAGLALIEQIDELAASGNLSVPFKLLTYAYPGQDVIGGYGQASVKALEAVSQKYDPEGFFQKAVPGGFKLPRRQE